jgi:Tol biopolymer transport system component
MTVRRTRLTDATIEQLLLARSLEADRAMVDQILTATERVPQRLRWLPIALDRRVLTLVTAALLLAALAGVIALAGRPVQPAPNRPPPGPEGGWIVYVNDGVMYRTSLTGDPEPMLNEGPSRQCPAFSPDGRLFAYMEGGNNLNMIVASLDEAGKLHEMLRIAAGSGACPKWSPDGRLVAFVGDDNQPRVVSLDGEVRKVTRCPSGTDCARQPGATYGTIDFAWTHDGSALVVLATSGRVGESHVVVLPLEDGELRFVLDAKSDETTEEWFHNVVPSPAGPYVAVASERNEWLDESSSRFLSGSLRVIDLDGVVVFEEESMDYSLQRDTIAWSPDGSRLAWSHRDGIMILEMGTGGKTTLLPLPAMPRAGTDVAVYWLTWSPDGQRFLLNVSTDTKGHAHAIVTVAADGSGDVEVHSPWTASLEWSYGFSWQPR